MAKMYLPTNFVDDILDESMDGKRRYKLYQNADGTVSLEDVTNYAIEGSTFGANQINATNTAVNESADKNKIIDDLNAVVATTQEGFMAGALAVKNVNEKLGGCKLSQDENGNFFIEGADSVKKKLGNLWLDLSPYANEYSGSTFTYSVYEHYSDFRNLTNENFKVGYVGLGSLSASAYVYALDGGASGGGSGTVGEPVVSYNNITGILTVSNVSFNVTASVSNRNGNASETTSKTMNKNNLLVILCEN